MREDFQGRPLYDQVCSGIDFAAELSSQFNFITCVPDSIFKEVLPHLPEWELAPRENHAIAMAFGARLAGKAPVVLMQNSGIGLALDALFGTFELYGQGCLVVISNRGQLPWEEIQHQHWGEVTRDVLVSCKIPVYKFHEIGLAGIPDIARQVTTENKIIALTVQRGNLNE